MKIIRSNDTQEFKNSDTCVATEYEFNDPAINIAVVKVTGRYPDSGRVVNEKCKELVFVLEGSGKIFIEEKEILLQKGDAVLIEPLEKIYWEGNLTMVIPCTPAWSSDQHTYIK
jgi:mannose-6-phosphate isomerase-like protein (cupin superfamily)